MDGEEEEAWGDSGPEDSIVMSRDENSSSYSKKKRFFGGSLFGGPSMRYSMNDSVVGEVEPELI